jgi:Ca2+-binding EF-hand superfamily protein
LLKAFKYFDLNNNGTVEPDEFAKAVEKIGIMIPTRQVSPILTQGRKDSPALLFLPDGINAFASERLLTRYD